MKYWIFVTHPDRQEETELIRIQRDGASCVCVCVCV